MTGRLQLVGATKASQGCGQAIAATHPANVRSTSDLPAAPSQATRGRAYDQSVYCHATTTIEQLAEALQHLPSGTFTLGLCNHPVQGATISPATRYMKNLLAALHTFARHADPGFTYTTIIAQLTTDRGVSAKGR